MVSKNHALGVDCTTDVAQREEHTEINLRSGENPSALSEAGSSGMSLIRRSLQNKGLSENTLKVIMASWRESTQKQYAGHLQKWQRFCYRRKIDMFSPTVAEVLEFLTELYQSNCSYSTLNSARSALSTVVILPGNISVGSHPLVARFLRGAFQTRPALPRYTSIWDVKVVLSFLKTLSPASNLTLRDLTLKLKMLIMLVSGQRIQTIQLLSLDNMKVRTSTVEFMMPCKVKQTKPGRHISNVIFKAYAPDRRLCVYNYLKTYLEVTQPLRNQTQLLISFTRPHKAVSRDTISRWLKEVLSKSGIDTKLFTAYSTRAASLSAAKAKDTPMDIILSAGGWSNASTFAKYYNKAIDKPNTDFATNVLHHAN